MNVEFAVAVWHGQGEPASGWLLVHWARRAASRADCTAGSSCRAISTAMIEITTSSNVDEREAATRSLATGDLVVERPRMKQRPDG